jgi:hypothetical protein
MKDDRRRARFLAWFLATYREDSASARSRFMADSARTGDPAYTKGRVSQLLDPRQPFGERAAENVAQRFGLPADYFERDDEASTPPPGLRVVSAADWDLLQEVRLVMSDNELERLHHQAALLLERAASVLQARKITASPPAMSDSLQSVYTGATPIAQTPPVQEKRTEPMAGPGITSPNVHTMQQRTKSPAMGDRAKRATLTQNESAAHKRGDRRGASTRTKDR